MERWTGLLIVLGVVIALMIPIWIYVGSLRSAHRKFAASQPASTLTVVGVRDKDLSGALARAQHGGLSPARVPNPFIVTFSTDGVRLWSGGFSPRVLETISADRVLGVDLGTYTESPEYRQPSLPRLKLTVAQLQDSAASPVDVQFGITKLTTGPFIARYLDEPGVQDLAAQAREALRGGHYASRAPSQSAPTIRSRPGTLEPGTTAYDAARLWGIPVKRVITALWIIAAPLVLWASFMRDVGFLVSVIAVQLAAIGLLLWRENRAVSREEAAGYTTLNGKHLHLEQRHPTSGMVIREAGGTAISQERFRELLGR